MVDILVRLHQYLEVQVVVVIVLVVLTEMGMLDLPTQEVEVVPLNVQVVEDQEMVVLEVPVL